MGLLTDTVRAMEVAGRPDGAFRKAVGALTEGDLNDADRWMRGTRADPTRTGFYDELLEVNGAVALNFDKEWTTILQNARNAQEPYLED